MIITFDNNIGLDELKSFLKFVPKDQMNRYCSNNLQDYIVNELTEKQQKELIALTTLGGNLLGKTYISVLMPPQKVNITVLDDGCIFSLPFTLGETIFFPKKYFNRSKLQNLKTLIHELIHINQRSNILKWNLWLLNNSDWTYKEFTVRDNMLHKNAILNPDTFYVQTWLYKKKYYCHSIENNNIIKNKWYCFEDNKFIPEENEIFDYEHPYEEFAYKIADEIINSINLK